MNCSKTIDAAGNQLKNSELGGLSHIITDWNAIDWKSSNLASGSEAQVVLSRPDTIVIYPAFSKLDETGACAALIREFGISVYTRHATKRAKKTWEEKLCLPLADQILKVQDRLKDPNLPSYRAIVESFERCLDRYVALNICNALMRPQFIPRQSALNLNIYTWGSTLDYAACSKAHRIVPFVHAYGSRPIAECPGRALAELVCHSMKSIRESSVAEAFRRVIVETFSRCR